jgi:hypothetical protein
MTSVSALRKPFSVKSRERRWLSEMSLSACASTAISLAIADCMMNRFEWYISVWNDSR